MCEECRALLTKYKEAVDRYADSVSFLSSALGMPLYDSFYETSNLLFANCHDSLRELDAHQSASHLGHFGRAAAV